MKKVLFTFVLMLTAFSAKAMSYQQARDQALFLTDKMAYELDLTEEQYEAAFEVNLDYLMSVNTVDDVYSVYWKRRNLDLSYILFDWQYRTFCGLEYFYRPLYWGDGFWHFRIYAYYPHRHYYYYGYPGCYYSYRGAHSWHANGGRSYYHGHHFTTHDYGMRGGWDRGGYRNMNQGWRHNDGGNRGYDPHSPAHNNNRPGNNRPGNSRPGNGSHSNIGGSGSSSHGSVGGSRTNGGNPRLGHSTVTSDRNDRNNRYGSASSSGSGYGNRRQDSSSSFSNGDTPRSSTRETARGHRTDGGTSYTPSRSFSGSNASSSYRNSSNGRGYNSGRSVGSSSSSRSSYSGGSSSSRSSYSGGSSSSRSSYSGRSSSSRSSYSGGSSSSRSVGHSSGSSSHSGGGGGHFGGGRR